MRLRWIIFSHRVLSLSFGFRHLTGSSKISVAYSLVTMRLLCHLVSILEWCTRRWGGLSAIASLCLCTWAIWNAATSYQDGLDTDHPATSLSSMWTAIYAYYSLAVHAMMAAFWIRVPLASFNLTQRMKAAQRRLLTATKLSLCDQFDPNDAGPDETVHVIIIPNYKENIEVLRETLEVLASHEKAQRLYHVRGL